MAETVVASRGAQFLVVTKGATDRPDPAAVGYIVDLARPDLPKTLLPVQTILGQGWWEPATDDDLAAARGDGPTP